MRFLVPNKSMKLTVAYGARSLSARRKDVPRAETDGYVDHLALSRAR